MTTQKIFLDDIDININGVDGHIFQVDVDNTGEGCTDQYLRIGSMYGLKNNYKKSNLPPAACDNEIITDQFGTGCKSAQRFSHLSIMDNSTLGGFIVRKIYVFSDNYTQLSASFKNCKVEADGNIIIRQNHIAINHTKDIKNPTRLVATGKWDLNKDEFIEFKSFANCKLTIVMIYMSVTELDALKQRSIKASHGN